ncbi:hypothetical protein FQN54_004108 [Arachnomyces sp. PD_36]|nr:hypothetical protein FQN54_004108 [Arachnomyces sp. PD_36]
MTTHAEPTATTDSPADAHATETQSADASAVTGCHKHGDDVFCINADGEEVQVLMEVTPTGDPPTEFTDCHSHGEDTFCVGPDGEEVEIVPEGEEAGGENCHFHAGVEHCVGEGESEGSSSVSCERRDRDYNIPLRIGSLFVILASSALAVFGPVLWSRFFNASMNGLAFTLIKQLGTGIMISTAFVHLLTHAQLMFTNECLGELQYEATTTAVVMAGLFLSFLVEYLGNRFVNSRNSLSPANDIEPNRVDKGSNDSDHIEPCEAAGPNLTSLGHHHHGLANPDDKLSVIVMEAGIIFHSIIIGLTLIVAGDSGYTSLFIVIIFHQMFEGLALGARIASLSPTSTSLPHKLIMAAIYALITPIGMAIGLGVIHSFNGNDKGTIIAMGTLDALSAGILAWVALVDMWSHDWLFGDLKDAGAVKTSVGMVGLVSGMVLMGLLGKWA